MSILKKNEEKNILNESKFLELIHEINTEISNGYLDEIVIKLKFALDYYENNRLKINIPNIFNYSINIIEVVSDRFLLIEQLMRIIQLSIKNNNIDTLGNYYKYYALTYATYGSFNKAFEIIESALILFEEKTPYSIDLYNVKAVIYSMNNQNYKSLKLFKKTFEFTKLIQYKQGYRYVLNIGVEYKNIGDYNNAILYMELGIKYCKELDCRLNQIEGLFSLIEVYIEMKEYSKAIKLLDELDKYREVKPNESHRELYVKNRYLLKKVFGEFKEALTYLEELLDFEKKIKKSNFKDMINKLNYNFKVSEKNFKNKNNNDNTLQLISEKLNSTNIFLNSTIEKNYDIQNKLESKDHKVEILSDKFNRAQKELINEKNKRYLNEMIVNFMYSLNMPLNVINTATNNINRYLDLIYKNNKMEKKDIEKCFLEIIKSTNLQKKNMIKVINFIENIKNYEVNDKDDIIEFITINKYYEDKKEFWIKEFGINEINIISNGNIKLKIKINLLNKCLDIIIKSISENTLMKCLDIEISEENSMITIGIGDFTDTQKSQIDNKLETDKNYYDFNIIKTIAEKLLYGRFIKFEESGKEFYQFIFPKYG